MIIIYRIMSNLDIDVLDLFADEGFSLEEEVLTSQRNLDMCPTWIVLSQIVMCQERFLAAHLRFRDKKNPDRQDCPYTYTCNC